MRLISPEAAVNVSRRSLFVGLLGLLVAMTFAVDVLFFPGVYIPSVSYFVPILLAAYFVQSPRVVSGLAIWTLAAQVVAYLLHGQGISLLPISYVLSLGVMSALILALTDRVRREVGLRLRVEDFAQRVQVQNEKLRSQSEELQLQNEEIQAQSEELQAQSHELGTRNDELLRQAAELAAVVESTQAQLALLDRDMNFVLVNSAYEHGSGYSKEKLIGRNHFELFPHAENRAIFERVRDTGEPYEVLEKPFEFADRPELGTTYWNWVLVPIKDEEGRTRELLLSLLDVTDQVRARRRVEAALKVRDEFLSIAAHELKTPVTSLRGFAQLVIRRYDQAGALDPDQLARAMTHIVSQTRRLERLTLELLDISRLESGKLDLSRKEATVYSVVEAALTPLREIHPARTFPVRADATTRAYLDTPRMEQVMTNLLENAVKFSPPDTPVEIEVAPRGAGEVRISVRDYGPGVPVSERTRIFERFHQAHPAKHFGGMGLGLYISAQIVAMHGGAITCDEPEGPGALFSVHLPVKASQPPPAIRS